METTIRITPGELTPALLSKIKALFEDEILLEITITPVSDFGLTVNENGEEYKARINNAIENLDSGKGVVSFSETEFGSLANNLLSGK